MSRYIDAKNLTLIKNLATLISESEVIDIVRCKECKYWLSDKPIKNKWFQNGEVDQCKWRTDESPNPDDFCSYGEREGE